MLDLSLFTNLIIDETLSKPENHCDDVVVYMSDTVEPGKYSNNLKNSNWIFMHVDNKMASLNHAIAAKLPFNLTK